ncbi:MAG: HD domain-containing protein [Armatimonadetes bacterium]|nr:HD domain-containing protein [Armatimonadota bacterium]MDE2207912.1 HD domain-containing protein [Armatimonadota bacterium]
MTEGPDSVSGDQSGAADRGDGVADRLIQTRIAILDRLRGAEGDGAASESGRRVQAAAASRELTAAADTAIKELFAAACAETGTAPDRSPIAIVATGGYGREELAPWSDIDLTFIAARDGNLAVDALVRSMFSLVMHSFMARAGIEVGYAYRLLSDFGDLHHHTLTGYMDARLLAGSQRLFLSFEEACWSTFNVAEFAFAKKLERATARDRYGTAPWLVEPNLKEGAGGLRDLQFAVWMAQAAEQTHAARARGERGVHRLAAWLDYHSDGTRELTEARLSVMAIRNTLQALSGADRNQLVATRHEETATALGWDVSDPKAMQAFMTELYGSMETIFRAADDAWERLLNSRLILSLSLDCVGGVIVPASSGEPAGDPAWAFWACEFAQRYDLQLGRAVRDRICAATGSAGDEPPPAACAEVFTRILAGRTRVWFAVRAMSQLGLLRWMIPELGPTMTQVPGDGAHQFTVGWHSLQLLCKLDSLNDPASEVKEELKRLYGGLPHPEQLHLAALLHDCAKPMGESGHAERGAEIVAEVCARLGWDAAAADAVCFLVRHHLLMSETARLRDVEVDATIRDFTGVVVDVERLDMLYLLTWADVHAVGAGIWSGVFGQYLSDLWRRASAVLTDEEPLGWDDAAIRRVRSRLTRDLALEKLPEAEVRHHVAAVPSSYLLNRPLNRIAFDIGCIRSVLAGEPVIDFRDNFDAACTEIAIYALDDPKPGLLARIAAGLYVCDLHVHSAQVVTRQDADDRIAMDTLLVDYKRRPILPSKRREVSTALRRLLSGELSADAVLATVPARKSAIVKAQPPVVTGSHGESASGLVIVEAVGTDAQSMLYQMAGAAARLGWHIVSARVSSWQDTANAALYLNTPVPVKAPDAGVEFSRELSRAEHLDGDSA